MSFSKLQKGEDFSTNENKHNKEQSKRHSTNIKYK